MEAIQGLKPGAFLRHDTYRIEKVLGQGGFGITYLATDMTLDRTVAIKEFFPKDYCDRETTTSHVTLGTQNTSEFVSRLKAKFLKEARNIAKFDHPGIIKIHAAFEENNTAYYVMDFIDGKSLSEIVKKEGPLLESKATEYVEKIGSALDYIHSRHINHLDVKPANIMIRRSDDMPILIDFGLSKQYDSAGNQTSTTPTGISHGFAPMEQYNDGGVKEFSPQTDLYSLAATYYYLLSGVTPPQATRLIDEELTFPQTVPTKLIKPILKAMSPGRKNRHLSINEFLKDIKSIDDKAKISEVVEETKTNFNEPTVETYSEPEDTGDYEIEETKGIQKWIWGAAGGIVLIALLIFMFIPKGSSVSGVSDSSGVVAVENELPTAVQDMEWDSPLGKALYTGSVIADTSSGSMVLIADGKGIAKIIDGEFKGSVYDGEFKFGKMEGQTTYTHASGDSFEGIFKDNKYSKGKYSIKATGEYFEGTFDKNGAPSKGQWYDKNGKKL